MDKSYEPLPCLGHLECAPAGAELHEICSVVEFGLGLDLEIERLNPIATRIHVAAASNTSLNRRAMSAMLAALSWPLIIVRAFS